MVSSTKDFFWSTHLYPVIPVDQKVGTWVMLISDLRFFFVFFFSLRSKYCVIMANGNLHLPEVIPNLVIQAADQKVGSCSQIDLWLVRNKLLMHWIFPFFCVGGAGSGLQTHPCSRTSWVSSPPFWTFSEEAPAAFSAPKWQYTRDWPAPGQMHTGHYSDKAPQQFWTHTLSGTTPTHHSRWKQGSEVPWLPNNLQLWWLSILRTPTMATAGATS